jgi:hypothetical protein
VLSGRYCRACLDHAAEPAGSCAECLCWTWLSGGRCKPCRLFGYHHDLGDCPSCGRQVPLGAAGRCRLCLATSRATGTIPSRQAGIQLFALVGVPARVRPVVLEPPRPGTAGLGQLRLSKAAAAHASARQEPNAEQRAKLRLVSRTREHHELQATLVAYGQARGWSPSTLRRVGHGLAAVLASQPRLSARSPLDAAAVREFLIERHLTALRVIEFLADQDLVASDRHATFDRWLARRLERLPAQIGAEVHTWTEVLRGRGPRAGRPRKAATIQGYLRALDPALAAWSARYSSLRQVTSDDVDDQLEPSTGPTRRLVASAMRSLFRALKARQVVFTNPTAGLEVELRRARWPGSANPYLLVNQSTAGGLAPVTRGWVQAVFQRLGLTAEDLRVDRLLEEVHATGGDPLKLTGFFGITEPTAIRYCLELGPLDQTIGPPSPHPGP